MANHSDHKQVYNVQSLEETKRILLSREKFELKTLFLKIFVSGWVLAANIFLHFLNFVLFKNRDHTHKEFFNIVIYTVGILGDNVVILPALTAIKRHYPQAKLTLITNCQKWSPQPAKELLKPLPYINHLVIVEDYDCPVQRHGCHFSIDVPEVKDIACDFFVNLSPFGNRGWLGVVIREMILAKLLGAKWAYGFRMSTLSKRNIFNSVQQHFVQNEPRRSEKVLKELGLKPTENEDALGSNPSLRSSVFSEIVKKGVDPKAYCVINPGAKFKAKCWAPERFASIADYISQHYNLCIILTGTSDEWDIAEEVIKSTKCHAINMAGSTTIQELIELLRTAKACVTNDTGTMHLAAMTGIPTVALFSGRHSPTHWLPIGRNVISIFTLPDCIYCYNDFCETPNCLLNISVDDVVRGLEGALNVTQPQFEKTYKR